MGERDSRDTDSTELVPPLLTGTDVPVRSHQPILNSTVLDGRNSSESSPFRLFRIDITRTGTDDTPHRPIRGSLPLVGYQKRLLFGISEYS